MAEQTLLYGNESWAVKIKDWMRIQAAKMKLLRSMKSCIKIDGKRNEDVRTQLTIFSLKENRNGSDISKRMDGTFIPKQAITYIVLQQN
jgi:hypothetical protein